MNRRIKVLSICFFSAAGKWGAVQPTTNETDAGCSLFAHLL
jgi:hypothetical protein